MDLFVGQLVKKFRKILINKKIIIIINNIAEILYYS